MQLIQFWLHINTYFSNLFQPIIFEFCQYFFFLSAVGFEMKTTLSTSSKHAQIPKPNTSPTTLMQQKIDSFFRKAKHVDPNPMENLTESTDPMKLSKDLFSEISPPKNRLYAFDDDLSPDSPHTSKDNFYRKSETHENRQQQKSLLTQIKAKIASAKESTGDFVAAKKILGDDHATEANGGNSQDFHEFVKLVENEDRSVGNLNVGRKMTVKPKSLTAQELLRQPMKQTKLSFGRRQNGATDCRNSDIAMDFDNSRYGENANTTSMGQQMAKRKQFMSMNEFDKEIEVTKKPKKLTFESKAETPMKTNVTPSQIMGKFKFNSPSQRLLEISPKASKDNMFQSPEIERKQFKPSRCRNDDIELDFDSSGHSENADNFSMAQQMAVRKQFMTINEIDEGIGVKEMPQTEPTPNFESPTKMMVKSSQTMRKFKFNSPSQKLLSSTPKVAKDTFTRSSEIENCKPSTSTRPDIKKIIEKSQNQHNRDFAKYEPLSSLLSRIFDSNSSHNWKM